MSGSTPPVPSALQTLLTARNCGALPVLGAILFIQSASEIGLSALIPRVRFAVEKLAGAKVSSPADRLLMRWQSTSSDGCEAARLT